LVRGLAEQVGDLEQPLDSAAVRLPPSAYARLGLLPWDVLDAAKAAATDRKEVMLAVANLRAVVTMLPTLLLR
jgi:hypothetical protein